MKELKMINENYILSNELDLILDFVKEEKKRAKENNEYQVLIELDKMLDKVFKVKMKRFNKLRDEGLNM